MQVNGTCLQFSHCDEPIVHFTQFRRNTCQLRHMMYVTQFKSALFIRSNLNADIIFLVCQIYIKYKNYLYDSAKFRTCTTFETYESY